MEGRSVIENCASHIKTHEFETTKGENRVPKVFFPTNKT